MEPLKSGNREVVSFCVEPLKTPALTRRRMVGLAVTLTIGGPLLALASGCGSGKGTAPASGGFGLVGNIPSSGGGTSGGTGATRSTGRVILPPGSPVVLSQSVLASGFTAAAAVQSDGSFTLDQIGGDAALVTLTNAGGQPLLLGFSGSTATGLVGEVSAAQTAVVLVFYALGAFTLPADAQEQVRVFLAQDSRVQALGTQIASALAANPLAIAQSDPALFGAVITLRDALLGGTTKAASPRSDKSRQTIAPTLINVNPANEVNGFFPAPNADGLGLTIMNSRRRNALLHIYATAYTDQAGTRHTDVDHKVVDGDIFWATSGLAGVVGSLVDYATGTVAYAPVTGGPYSLDLFPADAASTEYHVDFIGNGNGGDPQNIHNDNPNYGSESAKISFITFVKDLLLPAIATFVGLPASIKLDLRAGQGLAGTELLKAFDDLAGIFSGVVDSTIAISQSNVKNLLIAVVKAIANNGTLRQQFIQWLVRNSFRFGFAAGVGGIVSGALASAANAIFIVVDKLLGGGDLGAVIADWGRSDTYSRFDTKVIAPKVKLNPATASIKNADSVTLTAVAAAASGVTNITYHWTILSGTGTLLNSASGLTGTSIDSSSPSIQYLSDANAKDGDQETVQVEAFVGGINDPNRVSIGKASSVITISTRPKEEIVNTVAVYEDYTKADYDAAGIRINGTLYGTVIVSDVFTVAHTSGYYLVRTQPDAAGNRTGFRINVRDILAATSISDRTPPTQGAANIVWSVAEPVAGQAYSGSQSHFYRRGNIVYFGQVERGYPFNAGSTGGLILDSAGTIVWINGKYTQSYLSDIQVIWRSE